MDFYHPLSANVVPKWIEQKKCGTSSPQKFVEIVRRNETDVMENCQGNEEKSPIYFMLYLKTNFYLTQPHLFVRGFHRSESMYTDL